MFYIGCFGKVVEGFEVVDRMHTGSKEAGSFESLVEYIGIEEIAIETDLEEIK